MRRLAVCCLALLFWPAVPAVPATLFDPALRFRTIATEHFIIYFHQGEEHLAPRLASIAEDAWRAVPERFGLRGPRRTHVVLADQSDAANGWAFPLPYNTIVVTSASPAASDFIGNTDDWLRLVFIHEFTHIVHLDQSAGWARWVRRIFGRTPLAFPNLFLPAWQIEGLATYAESVMTGEGRFFAGDFRQIERAAARVGTAEPLDRVNGGLTSWPNGLAPYAYGLGFHQFLADRYGTDRVGDLARQTAGRVPFTASRVFVRIFGRTLGELWNEYQRSLVVGASRQTAGTASMTRLTRHGFTVGGPRFVPCASDGACDPEIVYAVRTPYEFPELRAVSSDGLRDRRVTSRYGGTTTGVGRDLLVFDQQEVRRNVAVFSDLFVMDRATGAVRALTTGSRLQDPDLSPDGRAIVAVQENRGERKLVLAQLGADGILSAVAPVSLPHIPGTQFNAPRWSPDGRAIVVERRRLHGPFEIVVVEPASAAERVVVAAHDVRFVTPTWKRDGTAVIAAAARDGEPFDLFEFPVPGPNATAQGTARQLTFTAGGATWPDVSPDGRTLVFAGYTPQGFDLFAVPYPENPPESRFPNPDSRIPNPDAQIPTPDPRIPNPEPQVPTASPSPYAPWKTLAPTSWSPIVETGNSQLRAGFSLGGYDVLGYHAYAAAVTWLLDAPSDVHRPSRSEPDWAVAYAYDRWRPTFFASASSDTSFFAGPPTDDGTPASSTVRQREIGAGVSLPFRRVRRTTTVTASLLRARDIYSGAREGRTATRAAARAAWTFTSAHRFGFSISPERGIAAGGTLELVRRQLGSDADASIATIDGRAYLPGLGRNHVLAVRGAAGLSTGDRDMGRTFLLGGATAGAVADFSSDAVGLLRTFPTASFAGRRAAAVNVDYRLPLARPQRGFGTWPFFLHTIHAAVFVDAGHAWTRSFDAAHLKTSAGAELSADTVWGYALPLTVTFGVGWGRDGAERLPSGRAVYLRVGHAF